MDKGERSGFRDRKVIAICNDGQTIRKKQKRIIIMLEKANL